MTLRVKMEGMQYTKRRPTTMLAIKTMRKHSFTVVMKSEFLNEKRERLFYIFVLLRITELVSLLEILIQTIMHAKKY